jgi:hypothetical protein
MNSLSFTGRFILCKVAFLLAGVIPATAAVGLLEYELYRGRQLLFSPAPAGQAPELLDELYYIDARAKGTDEFDEATLLSPVAGPEPMWPEGDSSIFFMTSDSEDLDRDYPPGAVCRMQLVLPGFPKWDLALSLPSVAYPPQPVLLDSGKLASVQQGSGLTLEWQPFSGYGASDYIQVVARDAAWNETFKTPAPGSVGALTGDRQKVELPASAWDSPDGLLEFYVSVDFYRITTLDQTTVPGAVGRVGLCSSTMFLVEVTPETLPSDVSDFGLLFGRVEGMAEAKLEFEAAARARKVGRLIEATVRLPSGQSVLLEPESDFISFRYADSVTSESEFAQKYASGAYLFQFSGVGDGEVSAGLTRPAAMVFPEVVTLANASAALSIDPDLPFEMILARGAPGRAGDLLHITIKDWTRRTVFSTPEWSGGAGVLPGDSTRLLVPAITLGYDASYTCHIRYVQIESVNTTDYPGATGRLGFFSETVVPLRTTPPQSRIVGPEKDSFEIGEEVVVRFGTRGVQHPGDWQVATGSLPPGMELESTGVLRGRPAAPGVFDFSLRTTDSEGQSVFAPFSIRITGEVEALELTTVNLPPAEGDLAYIAEMGTAGGVLPVRYLVGSGKLPAGLALHSESGLLHGIPRESGTFEFTIEVSDASGQTAARSLTLNVPEYAPLPTFSITAAVITGQGTVLLKGDAGAGQVCTIESSADLKNWTPVSTGTTLSEAGIEAPILDSSRQTFFRYRLGPPAPPVNPMSASLKLSSSLVIEKEITQDGGVLSLTNGQTVITLEIPANAFFNRIPVRMTWIDQAEGAPVNAGYIGGVHLEPEGTQLIVPGTLTITAGAPMPPEVMAFSYIGQGDDLHPTLSFIEGNTLRIPVLHFSGETAGVPNEADRERIRQHLGCSPRSRAVGELAKLLDTYRQRQWQGLPDAWPSAEELRPIFEAWHEEAVAPLIKAAQTDEKQCPPAANEFLTWWRVLLLVGFAEAFPLTTERDQNLLSRALLHALNKTHVRAVNENVPMEAFRMWEWAQLAQWMGWHERLPGKFDFDVIADRFLRTFRFELKFKSNYQISGMGVDIGGQVYECPGYFSAELNVDGAIVEVDPVSFGAARLIFKERRFPLTLTEWKHPCPWERLAGRAGYMELKDLYLQPRDKTPEKNDDSPCPKFNRPYQEEPFEKLFLVASFADPTYSLIWEGREIYSDVWQPALELFHSSEMDGDDFVFHEKWQYTWRKLVARANYTFPPKPMEAPFKGQAIMSTEIELWHKPLPLRKRDTWLPDL